MVFTGCTTHGCSSELVCQSPHRSRRLVGEEVQGETETAPQKPQEPNQTTNRIQFDSVWVILTGCVPPSRRIDSGLARRGGKGTADTFPTKRAPGKINGEERRLVGHSADQSPPNSLVFYENCAVLEVGLWAGQQKDNLRRDGSHSIDYWKNVHH